MITYLLAWLYIPGYLYINSLCENNCKLAAYVFCIWYKQKRWLKLRMIMLIDEPWWIKYNIAGNPVSFENKTVGK